jgi:hypothetical protein
MRCALCWANLIYQNHHAGCAGPMSAAIDLRGGPFYAPPNNDVTRTVMDMAPLKNSKEHRATYIGASPVFKGKTCMVRITDYYSTLAWAQFDERIDLHGLDYSIGWHPFALEAFRVEQETVTSGTSM